MLGQDCSKKSANKFVPVWIKNKSIEFLELFLEAFNKESLREWGKTHKGINLKITDLQNAIKTYSDGGVR